MRRIWILNDLFVEPLHRSKGVAKLLKTAEQHARDTEAVRIVLSTQVSNTAAQALYASLGYLRDEMFYHYALSL
jgi:GNAT superfamily N-acetyltransferase